MVAEDTGRDFCPKCCAFGYRYNGGCPNCDDIVSETRVPIVAGGQGRSAREIQRDASALVLTLGIGLLLVVCLCVGSCMG